jgi:hypothetical protein
MPNLSGLKEEDFDNISIQGVDVTTSVFSTTKNGLVPASGTSNTTDFLRRDGTFQSVVVPTNNNQLTNGANYITSADIPTIPTNNNQLTNGANYITSADIPSIPTNNNQLTNGANYITSADIPSIPTNNNQLTNGANYITAADIPTIPTPTAGDSTKVITVNSGGNYELGTGASSTYDTTLDGNIEVGTTVGAFSSGDTLTSLGITGLTITQILDKMLFPDTNPTIGNNNRGSLSFTNWSTGTVQVNTEENSNITINVNKGSYTSNIATVYCGDITGVDIILDTNLDEGDTAHKTFDLADVSNSGYDAINANETQIYLRSQVSTADPLNDGKYIRFKHSSPPNDGGTPPTYSKNYSRASLKATVTFGEGPTPLSSHGNPFTRNSPLPVIPSDSGFTRTLTVTKYAVFPVYIGNDNGTTSLTDSEGMETNYTKMSSLPNTLFFIGGTLNDRNNMFDDSTVAANDLKISIASQATRLAKYGVEFNQNFAEVHTSNKVHKIAIPKAFYDQRDTDEPIICFDNAAEKYISTADAFTGNNATSKYVINNIKLDGGFGTDSDELIDYVEFKKNTSLSNNQNIATSTALLLTLTP